VSDVLWPLLVVLSFAVRWGRRWLTVVLAAVIVVGPITCIPLFAPSPDAGPASVYYAPPISMSSLASGCLAALVLDRLRTTGRWRARTGTSVTWCGVGLLAVLAVLLPPGWKSDPVALLGMIPAAGVASALLVTGLGTSDTVLSRALSARPLAWFGARASYSMYIWHMTVAAVVLPLVDGVPGRALALLVAIAVGVLGGVAVEQPADRLRRRLLRPRPPRVETS
jgi:peptidoglycan/LPS O-acetylase OafA/YrhL